MLTILFNHDIIITVRESKTPTNKGDVIMKQANEYAYQLDVMETLMIVEHSTKTVEIWKAIDGKIISSTYNKSGDFLEQNFINFLN